MKIVDVTTSVAEHLGVPPECVEELHLALDKIFIDGVNALSCNSLATDAVRSDLTVCQKCVSAIVCDSNVINGDDWARANDQASPDNSVDIIALCTTEGDSYFVPIEGKLGMAFDSSGDKTGLSLRLKSLEDKYLGSSSLLGRNVNLLKKLIVVVPSGGQQWMWYRIRGWNSRGNKIGKIFSCCVADLISLLGYVAPAKPKQCERDVYRTRLLLMEFAKPGPMSSAQLPPHDSCIGCGKCRDVCRDLVRRHAIAMVPNEAMEGMPLRPFVDEKSCVGCRVCEKHCPILNLK